MADQLGFADPAERTDRVRHAARSIALHHRPPAFVAADHDEFDVVCSIRTLAMASINGSRPLSGTSALAVVTTLPGARTTAGSGCEQRRVGTDGHHV